MELEEAKDLINRGSTREKMKEENAESLLFNLRAQLEEKEREIRKTKEEAKQSKLDFEEYKSVTNSEMRKNDKEIQNIKNEYQEEVERLSEILNSLTEKCNAANLKLAKSDDIIKEYKKVIENVNATKEEKMNELVAIEIEYQKSKKALEVLFLLFK